MADEGPQKLQLDDDRLAEITKKISDEGKSDLQKQQEIFAKINNQKITPPTEVGVKNPSSTTPEPPKNVVIKSLRTFQGDAAEIIKNQNSSVLSIALAEKKKKQEEVKVRPPENPELKKKILTISLSIALVILGVGAIAIFYYLQKNAPPPTTIQERDNTIVSYTQKIVYDTAAANRDKLLEVLQSKRREIKLNTGEIAYIAFTKQLGEVASPIATDEFFALLNTKAPGSALRAFGQNFMFGFYGTEKTDPFLLVKLSSFENAFDGMLRWEKTLNEDIGALFTLRTLSITSPQPIATSSSAGTTSPALVTQVVNLDTPVSQGFIDETSNNKDMRVLKNVRGDIIMLYSFIDKETLLFTSSETVLRDMVGKVISQKLIR